MIPTQRGGRGWEEEEEEEEEEGVGCSVVLGDGGKCCEREGERDRNVEQKKKSLSRQ